MTDIIAFYDEIVAVWNKGAFGVEVDSLIMAGLILVVFLVLRGLFSRFVLGMLARMASRTETRVDDELIAAIDGPVRFVFIVAGLFFAMRVAPLPEGVDTFMTRVVRSLIAFTIFWALYCGIHPMSFLLDSAMARVGGIGMASTLKNFVVKIVRILVVVFGFAAVLQEWNFDIAAVLGGLGLIGMAVAFGAQNLIANLFGGVAIFLDHIFAEGEWIRVNDVEGTVESIGFRTTKIRRFDKSLVTVPNAKIADSAVTNFSRMTNRRIYWMIGLEYRTTADQLKAVVAGIDRYVRESGDFETDPAKVSTLIHVDSFNDSSIDIMLYCFTRTTKWAEWMRVKEALLYHIKGLVEGAGASFAFPSSSIYVEQLPFGTPEAIPGPLGEAPAGQGEPAARV